MKAFLMVVTISLISGAALAVPSDWIAVDYDKNGNPVGYVTHKMPSIIDMTEEFCIEGLSSPLAYPMCFQDVGGPESDDDED
jgi:hypothetical protein